MDVEAATEELGRSSFVEILESSQDGQLFLIVPLVAAVFGKRKLATSSMKSAIELDVQALYAFGAAQQSDIKLGVTPRVEKLFSYVAYCVSGGKESLADFLPMLEFIAGKFPPAWLLLAKLYQELESARDLEKAKEATKRYIESVPNDPVGLENAWGKLAILCQLTQDVSGEIQARVEICKLPDVPFRTVSDAIE